MNMKVIPQAMNYSFKITKHIDNDVAVLHLPYFLDVNTR